MQTNIIKTIIALVMLITATTAHSGILQVLTSEARDWRFMQAVGGIKVSAKGTTLTVDCNVTGVERITVEPTIVNSALGVHKVKHQRQNNTILLTVYSGLRGTIRPKPLDLSAYPDGEYAVEYLDADGARHPVGKVTLKK